MASKLIGRFSGFEQDMAALEKQVKYALTQAGTALQDDMRDCLREHIDNDVYNAFDPAAYVRRGDDGGLSDMEKNTRTSPPPSEFGGGVMVQLDYTPDGQTDGIGRELTVHTDGDSLIGRIEHRIPDYDWNRVRYPDDRSFFHNFVQEMVDNGRAEKTLVRAVNAVAPSWGVTADGGVIRENDDWR